MATVQTIINDAYAKVNGEYEAVTEGSDDFKTYLNALNQMVSTWARTPYVKWQSLFNMDYTLPETVEADKLSYTVTDAGDIHIANTPFDSVYFINEDGEVVDKYKMTDQALFDAAPSSEVNGSTKLCAYLSGKLYLKAVSDKIVGTTIRLPVYVYPTKYTLGSQEVSIDSPQWLVVAMAAFICDASPVPFIARNADKYYKQADMLLKDMRINNRHLQHLIIERHKTNIPHTWDDVVNIMTIKDL